MADISRGDALALMAEDRAPEIWQEATKSSVAMATFRSVNMGKRERIVPFLEALPATPAGGPFVNGDTGRKPTLDMGWATKVMTAEEIAGIVPIPENVLTDVDIDIWSEVRPRIVEYVSIAIDRAVFGGINAPASWPTGGLAQIATDAGNVLSYNTFITAGPGAGTGAAGPDQTDRAAGYDLAGAYSELLGIIEEDGFEANTVYAKKSQKRALRNLRDNQGDPVLTVLANQAQVWSTPLYYWNTGNVSPVGSTVRAIVADNTKAIIGHRSDLEFKLLDQATLTDGAGNVLISLAENDMLALRFKVRLGFSFLDPTTIEGGSGASPFAVFTD